LRINFNQLARAGHASRLHSLRSCRGSEFSTASPTRLAPILPAYRLPIGVQRSAVYWVEESADGETKIRQHCSSATKIVFDYFLLSAGSLLACWVKKRKVKEEDLYSAFIEVPYTQGAQVRITQILQITPYLPLPRKHSPDGASQTEVADI